MCMYIYKCINVYVHYIYILVYEYNQQICVTSGYSWHTSSLSRMAGWPDRPSVVVSFPLCVACRNENGVSWGSNPNLAKNMNTWLVVFRLPL